jgi:hypothetical protein
VYVGCQRKYRLVFKLFISCTPGKKRRFHKKKRDADDFCKGNIRQLICRKYFEVKIHVI